MKSKPGFLYRIPFYPLLLGIYAVLYLWLVNVFQVPPEVVIRPLLLALAITLTVCGLTWLILRKMRKAAAVAGLLLALFFIYGRVYDLIDGWKLFGLVIGRHRYFIILWAALFIVLAFLIIRSHSEFFTLTWICNLVVSFLMLLTAAQLGIAAVGSARAAQQSAQAASSTSKLAALNPQADANSPDVYYILMDGHDREDLLQQNIGVSDHAFITQLQQLGFVVPSCTQSNYNTTTFSVAGTFNMNYLDTLGFSYLDLSKAAYGVEFSTPELEAVIHANPVMAQFKNMGYQLITFQEPYSFINFPTSNIVYDYIKDAQSQVESSKFQYMFWNTTGVEYYIQRVTDNPTQGFNNLPDWLQQALSKQYSLYQKYEQDLYQLDKLDHITEVPGKKFVYAHLLVTHPDFAFKADGSLRDDSLETKQAYADSVAYNDQRMLAIVKNILATSKTPPIIILQGDHGYGIAGRGVEQFKILNAYYLPQGGGAAVYPSITPVNTFRLILSRYFGQNLPLLPDQSIWIHNQFPGGYQIEPGTCEP